MSCTGPSLGTSFFIRGSEEIALLQAFQLNEIKPAINTLQELLEQQVGRQKVIAEAKMDLAIYICWMINLGKAYSYTVRWNGSLRMSHWVIWPN